MICKFHCILISEKPLPFYNMWHVSDRNICICSYRQAIPISRKNRISIITIHYDSEEFFSIFITSVFLLTMISWLFLHKMKKVQWVSIFKKKIVIIFRTENIEHIFYNLAKNIEISLKKTKRKSFKTKYQKRINNKGRMELLILNEKYIYIYNKVNGVHLQL